MKRVILASVLALGFSAFADNVGDTTPTGDNVQFDVRVQVSVCTLNAKGEIVKCDGTNDPKPVDESMSAELIHSQCSPKCTFNDSASFSKTYKMKDATGKEVSADLAVWFSRSSEVFNDTVPDYDVQISLNPSNGKNTDDRDSLTTVKDLNALTSILVNGKKIRRKLADGNVYELQPYAILNHFKIVKK